MRRPAMMGDVAKRTKEEIRDGIEFVVGEKEYSEWKKFAFKGQMVQMAIAFMLGTAFGKVVKAISESLIMPIINWGLSFTGENWRTFKLSPLNGLDIEIGVFLSAFVDFMLISIILYIIYRKLLKPLFEEEKGIKCIEIKSCPHCFDKINWQATRCPSCCGEII